MPPYESVTNRNVNKDEGVGAFMCRQCIVQREDVVLQTQNHCICENNDSELSEARVTNLSIQSNVERNCNGVAKVKGRNVVPTQGHCLCSGNRYRASGGQVQSSCNARVINDCINIQERKRDGNTVQNHCLCSKSGGHEINFGNDVVMQSDRRVIPSLCQNHCLCSAIFQTVRNDGNCYDEIKNFISSPTRDERIRRVYEWRDKNHNAFHAMKDNEMINNDRGREAEYADVIIQQTKQDRIKRIHEWREQMCNSIQEMEDGSNGYEEENNPKTVSKRMYIVKKIPKEKEKQGSRRRKMWEVEVPSHNDRLNSEEEFLSSSLRSSQRKKLTRESEKHEETNDNDLSKDSLELDENEDEGEEKPLRNSLRTSQRKKTKRQSDENEEEDAEILLMNSLRLSQSDNWVEDSNRYEEEADLQLLKNSLRLSKRRNKPNSALHCDSTLYCKDQSAIESRYNEGAIDSLSSQQSHISDRKEETNESFKWRMRKEDYDLIKEEIKRSFQEDEELKEKKAHNDMENKNDERYTNNLPSKNEHLISCEKERNDQAENTNFCKNNLLFTSDSEDNTKFFERNKIKNLSKNSDLEGKPLCTKNTCSYQNKVMNNRSTIENRKFTLSNSNENIQFFTDDSQGNSYHCSSENESSSSTAMSYSDLIQTAKTSVLHIKDGMDHEVDGIRHMLNDQFVILPSDIFLTNDITIQKLNEKHRRLRNKVKLLEEKAKRYDELSSEIEQDCSTIRKELVDKIILEF